MLQVREQSLFEGVELSQPCKQWSSKAVIVAPICIQHRVRRFESPSDPHLRRSVMEVQLVHLAFHQEQVCTCE